ncbi:pilus assembly protein PilM [Bacillus sp. M6-12]|uniref:type IV pilus biogenesis protein PilM n=1 Tax=Bacillus sp. M6-12 TaxID=2054166 RepID=UPI000C792501|nr:pilus assembly protein PilM [Bacillus sp. M6-12]PLS16861.1 pilus assembly protein PilM [Bacillus sp. M6-12]
MALSLFSGKNRIVNLSIKDHAIRYVEMKQTNPPIISKCGEYYLPSGIIKDGRIVDFETLSTILEQQIDEWKIQKRSVRFLVPDPFIVIRKVQIPLDVKDDEIKGYLYLELGTSIHLPFEEPVFDAVVLGESDGKKELLLFAAPEEIIMDYNMLLEDCRLTPVAADISSLALYRLYYRNDQAVRDDHLLLLEFDLFSVSASIFVDHKPIFMRHIPIQGESDEWEAEGTRSRHNELSYTGDKEQYLTMLEDTYKEIERVMSFYQYSLNQGQSKISKILLCGDHPYLPELLKVMSSQFDVGFEIINQDELSHASDESVPYRFNAALGLALKGVR